MQLLPVWNFSDTVNSKVFLLKQGYFKNILRPKPEIKIRKMRFSENYAILNEKSVLEERFS